MPEAEQRRPDAAPDPVERSEQAGGPVSPAVGGRGPGQHLHALRDPDAVVGGPVRPDGAAGLGDGANLVAAPPELDGEGEVAERGEPARALRLAERDVVDREPAGLFRVAPG